MAMAPRALTLLLIALTTAIPATSDAHMRVATDGYILAECNQQAAAPSASNGIDAASSAFHARLHTLLVDLPSAAAPTGFATLQYSDNGAPFVRGLCFDDLLPSGGCAGCLTDAAKKIADDCGGSRRAGVWNAGCFVGYGDTNSSSPHEDAYRGRDFTTDGVSYPVAFYDAHDLAALALSLAPLAAHSISGRMMASSNLTTSQMGKVRAAAHCAWDVTAADCARCVERSAGELLRNCCGGDWELDGRHEGVAVVAGFKCHLRLDIHAPRPDLPLPLGKKLLKTMKENVALVVLAGFSFLLLVATAIFLIIILRTFRAAQQQQQLNA